MQRRRPISLASQFSGAWVDPAEAIAWVASRDASFARSMAKSRHLDLCIEAALLRADALPSHLPTITIPRAIEFLLLSLRHGEISSVGMNDSGDQSSRKPEHITEFEWSFLTFNLADRIFAETVSGHCEYYTVRSVGICVNDLIGGFPPPPIFIAISPVQLIEDRRHSWLRRRDRLSHKPSSSEDNPSGPIHLLNLAMTEDCHSERVPQPDTAGGAGMPKPSVRKAINRIFVNWIENGGKAQETRPTWRMVNDAGVSAGGTRGQIEKIWGELRQQHPDIVWTDTGNRRRRNGS